jgi:hydrogenase maturation factor
MKTGKLPIPLLDSLLKRYASKDKTIVIGPKIGVDAAIIKWGNAFLAAKTDPITFTSFKLGEYLVNINANDIACMGGAPKYLLVTLLLPAKNAGTVRTVEKIFSELSAACKRFGISLCGGHTEITPAVLKPVAIGAMLGEIKDKKRVYPPPCRAGDEVVLVKGIAIEGTAILAREKSKELEKAFGKPFLTRASNYIKKPGISVLREAEIAWRHGKVKAMHDPTEHGLSGGLYEMSLRLNMGMVIYRDEISILPECKKICGYFGLNPFGLISSGTLLAVTAGGEGKKLAAVYKRKGIRAAVIGKLTKKSGVRFKDKKFPYFERDEITKVL